MVIPLFIGAMLLTMALARVALITPFLGGMLGLTLAAFCNVDYNLALFFCISLYVTAFIANSIPECCGLSMSVSSMIELGDSSYDTSVLAQVLTAKILILPLFCLLPLSKPPGYIQGLLAIVIVGTALFIKRDYFSPIGSFIRSVIIMLIGFCGLFMLYNHYGNGNAAIALITAVAVPNLLFSSEDDRYQPVGGTFPFATWIICLIYTWLTPGLSSAAVGQTMSADHRTVGMAALEAAIEGYVIHLAMLNTTSGKTPLGDLLGGNAFELGTFTLTTETKLIVLGAVALGLVSVFVTLLLPVGDVPVSPLISMAILVFQAVVTTNLLWTLLFIGTGIVVKILCFRDPEVNAMGFIAPTLT